MENHAQVIGEFGHYTSKKGTLPLRFIINVMECGEEGKLSVTVKNEALAKVVLDGRSANSSMYVEGKVTSRGLDANVVEWIDD